MSAERQQAIEYLRAPANGLWRWAESGSVLVWHDGATLAFREEITQILEWLAPNGLPPFGALVFLLAACRGKVPATIEIFTGAKAEVPAAGGPQAEVPTAARRQLTAQLEAALAQLSKVEQLPAELNSGLKVKCILAEAVFEPAKVERHADAQAILRGLRQPFNDAELIDPERTGVGGGYVRQIHIVAEGLKLHSVETLALRLRTGLDALPQELDLTMPPAGQARQLIEDLSRDRELGAIGRAASELLAAVRLPRRLGEREQMAVGGVADITNRGPLDRLLLSELAHDDLTLSVRVALNEALYLRREPPMREPPGMLALLLDSGVRLWGTPRILAAAVALALVARDKQHAQVLAWRAQGARLLPVDLLSRNGLIEHLGALETNAHPGEALAAFAAATPPGTQNQTVLITHRDALNDPDFRRALAAQSSGPGFAALVDRDGKFELHALPLARRQPLCEAQLDIAEIFADPPGVPLLNQELDPELPAILRATPFPFLQPVNGRVDFWSKAEDGFTYALLNDRRLVRFRDLRAGGRVLASELPGGRTIWMDCVAGALHLVKAGTSRHPTRLVSVPLAGGPVRVTDLVSGLELQAVHRCGETILVIRTHDVRAYSLGDGRLLGHSPNPHRWVHGRFLRGQSHFYFAVWDGENVKFEAVTLPGAYSSEVVVAIFDREGLEGPWLVNKGGLIFSSATSERQKLVMPPGRSFGLDAVRVSRNGHRLYASMSSMDWGQLKDLQSGEVENLAPARGRKLELDPPPPLPTWNLFRVVEAIAVVPDGLAICGRRDRWRKITLLQDNTLRILDLDVVQQPVDKKASFGAPPKATKRGCSLQTAEWPDGSKAFLDSRGLLHLQSRDPAVQEISLVLAVGEGAGWTADGLVCGPPFFFDEERIPRTSYAQGVPERHPLIPSFSPTGGEGARRADEGVAWRSTGRKNEAGEVFERLRQFIARL